MMTETPKTEPDRERLVDDFNGSAELKKLLGLGPSRWGRVNSRTIVIDGKDLTDKELKDLVKGKPIKEELNGGSGSS